MEMTEDLKKSQNTTPSAIDLQHVNKRFIQKKI